MDNNNAGVANLAGASANFTGTIRDMGNMLRNSLITMEIMM